MSTTWCVFNSWHIAQNKATKIEKSQHVRYVLVLTKLKRYAKYGIHKLATSLYHTSHSFPYVYVTQAWGAFRGAHTNVQITTNTELLFYYSLNPKNLLSVRSFFCFFLHFICKACNVATWAAYFIYILIVILVKNSFATDHGPKNEPTTKKCHLTTLAKCCMALKWAI